MTKPWDYIAKVVNIGDSGCGKSSLTIRLCEGRFTPSHEVTIGVDFGSRIIPVSEEPLKKIKLQIWDTAGQESFRAITRGYFRGATGALLVFDVTRRETYEHAQSWLEELRSTADSNISIILVGNKADLVEPELGGRLERRKVTREEAEEWVQKNGVRAYVETSAKTGEKVEEAFVECAKEIYRNIVEGVYDMKDRSHGIKENTTKVSMGIDEQTKTKGGCC